MEAHVEHGGESLDHFFRARLHGSVGEYLHILPTLYNPSRCIYASIYIYIHPHVYPLQRGPCNFGGSVALRVGGFQASGARSREKVLARSRI